MEEAVTKQHAHQNTVFRCLYGFYCLGYTKQELAKVYNKSEKTIRNWIKVYDETGTYERAQSSASRRFTASHRKWLCDFYAARPLAYLDEAQAAFKRAHHIEMSKASVWRIIHECGLTRKVLERRAMHIKEQDIFRFVEVLSHIDWCHHNLVFLDEVSFDNRGMIRKRGTFDRVEFVKCCKTFAYSANVNVRQYPGSHSVWILDGASIHRDPEIVHFLRSIGIVPLFLPAYCPFFNPIELLFGYIKKAFQRYYVESSKRDILPFVVETFQRFKGITMERVFDHCGWKVQGDFDPSGPMSKEQRRTPPLRNDSISLGEDEDGLGYIERRVSL